MLLVASKLAIIFTILTTVGIAPSTSLILFACLLAIGFLWYLCKGTCMHIGRFEISANAINWRAIGLCFSFTVSLGIWAIILEILIN